MKPGTLYLIPASLGLSGNEADELAHVIPEEVKTITAKLPYFIAENAKSARAHLNAISKTKQLTLPIQQIRISELNIRTNKNTLFEFLKPILAGQDAGLISEAGVPAVADPGANLVELAHQNGITVKPLVGPSSILLALMGSGLNGQNFAFNGYLPSNPNDRAKQIVFFEKISRQKKQTQIFIETPYRNLALFDALCESCNKTTLLCLATDLTLPSESIQTKTINQWQQKKRQNKLPDMQRKPTIFLFQAK